MKNYFIYEDKLRRVVSIVTGVLIAVYSILSGIMITQIISQLLFGILRLDIWILLLYFITGMIVAAVLLRICILFIELMLQNIEIEKYSYLRLLLLASVVMYFIISTIYLVIILWSTNFFQPACSRQAISLRLNYENNFCLSFRT